MKAETTLLSLVLAVVLAGCASRDGLRRPLSQMPAPGDPSFRQTLGNILGTPFTGGNRVTTLNNGNQIFPAMLNAIHAAQKTITFESYIFSEGEVPLEFVDALVERARAGVKVQVILDAIGASKSKGYYGRLREAGVELERYNHLFYYDIRRMNYRTHRKLLVVDGRIGFIGGAGIAEEWSGDADSPKHWHDYHYQIEGPVVAQLQGAFAANWLKTHHELLVGPDYFPALPDVGKLDANSFYSSPSRGRAAVPVMYHMAIRAARTSLIIENPYFVPDGRLMEALTSAAGRGVKVQIILPGRHMDSKQVRRASRKRFAKLLAAGIEIYEYQPTMIHSKLMIVDGLLTSVGSANFDNRSLVLNDEANLNVLDAGFARELKKQFDRDLTRCVRVTPENLKDKSLLDLPLEQIELPLENEL